MVKMMNPYILSAEVNIFNGVLAGSIPFKPGLNILSGENGTFKTKLLQEIKSGNIKVSNDLPSSDIKILAFSPKRNSERKKIQDIFRELRQKNRDLANYISQRTRSKIQDNTFENYSALGELYYYVYEKECRDGGDQKLKMTTVRKQFNIIIKEMFENYELFSEWDAQTGNPTIILKKNNVQEIPLESLSCGEQEILSLVLNLYVSRDSYDVFLIDEPEVHLNWHLEEKLFAFLDLFCSNYGKQVIVATHSRIVFKNPFLKRTQFLFWNDGSINYGKNIPEEQCKKIAGEAIDIIKLGDFAKPTFFVEDRGHVEVIESISDILGKQVSISECGCSDNVISLFKLSLNEGGWSNSYFLIDGNNRGNPFPDKDQFIHLEKYCIENYLLNFKIAAKVTNKTTDEIKQAILNSIKNNRDKILKKNKYFEFLFDFLRLEHITEPSIEKLDASEILDDYLVEISMERSAYVDKYLTLLHKESGLESFLPERLVKIIRR